MLDFAVVSRSSTYLRTFPTFMTRPVPYNDLDTLNLTGLNDVADIHSNLPFAPPGSNRRANRLLARSDSTRALLYQRGARCACDAETASRCAKRQLQTCASVRTGRTCTGPHATSLTRAATKKAPAHTLERAHCRDPTRSETTTTTSESPPPPLALGRHSGTGCRRPPQATTAETRPDGLADTARGARIRLGSNTGSSPGNLSAGRSLACQQGVVSSFSMLVFFYAGSHPDSSLLSPPSWDPARGTIPNPVATWDFSRRAVIYCLGGLDGPVWCIAGIPD